MGENVFYNDDLKGNGKEIDQCITDYLLNNNKRTVRSWSAHKRVIKSSYHYLPTFSAINNVVIATFMMEVIVRVTSTMVVDAAVDIAEVVLAVALVLVANLCHHRVKLKALFHFGSVVLMILGPRYFVNNRVVRWRLVTYACYIMLSLQKSNAWCILPLVLRDDEYHWHIPVISSIR